MFVGCVNGPRPNGMKNYVTKETKTGLRNCDMTRELQTDSSMTDGTIQCILYMYTYFKGYLEVFACWA